MTANREDGIGYIESAGGLARDNIVDGNADDGFDISDYAAPTYRKQHRVLKRRRRF